MKPFAKNINNYFHRPEIRQWFFESYGIEEDKLPNKETLKDFVVAATLGDESKLAMMFLGVLNYAVEIEAQLMSDQNNDKAEQETAK